MLTNVVLLTLTVQTTEPYISRIPPRATYGHHRASQSHAVRSRTVAHSRGSSGLKLSATFHTCPVSAKGFRRLSVVAIALLQDAIPPLIFSVSLLLRAVEANAIRGQSHDNLQLPLDSLGRHAIRSPSEAKFFPNLYISPLRAFVTLLLHRG